MGSKKNLYLVRHGETLLNRYKRMQGWSDSPLTEEGKMVAMDVGKILSSIKFDRVFTSDSGRTIETAEIILQQNTNITPIISKSQAFRETYFGGFEGEKSDVAWNKIAVDNGYSNFQELIQNSNFEDVANYMKKSDPYHHAESYSEIWERIECGLQEVISTNMEQEENILIVTHGNTIRTILKKFSSNFNPATEIKNASISVVEYSNSAFRVLSINE